ncbi:hypothetical protein LV457_05775 [Mycobacterium sp. MYCO198283]|uniref:hypothetical protein n=1 Tax=Mycobacterium sp. MYCO198283 TaxID=2883505 RepID=UPI001E371E22|nr:hypothetical protein [Mycobacterium sp. MYCO198283]MCG5431800.1 hypothetical protein [Mycobacterium sp. MYCO198283]
MPATEDGITAVPTGNGRWRWTWRAPWGAVHTAHDTNKTEALALAAGRRWLRKQQRP